MEIISVERKGMEWEVKMAWVGNGKAKLIDCRTGRQYLDGLKLVVTSLPPQESVIVWKSWNSVLQYFPPGVQKDPTVLMVETDCFDYGNCQIKWFLVELDIKRPTRMSYLFWGTNWFNVSRDLYPLKYCGAFQIFQIWRDRLVKVIEAHLSMWLAGNEVDEYRGDQGSIISGDKNAR